MRVPRGEGGIRTLDGGIHPHNALAGRRLQPLGHFSVRKDIVPAGFRAAQNPSSGSLPRPSDRAMTSGCGFLPLVSGICGTRPSAAWKRRAPPLCPLSRPTGGRPIAGGSSHSSAILAPRKPPAERSRRPDPRIRPTADQSWTRAMRSERRMTLTSAPCRRTSNPASRGTAPCRRARCRRPPRRRQ